MTTDEELSDEPVVDDHDEVSQDRQNATNGRSADADQLPDGSGTTGAGSGDASDTGEDTASGGGADDE